MLITRTIEKARTKLKSLIIYSKSSLKISYFFLPLSAYQRERADASVSQPQLSEKTCINCAKAARLKPRVPKNTLENAANWQINGAHRSNFTVR